MGLFTFSVIFLRGIVILRRAMVLCCSENSATFLFGLFLNVESYVDQCSENMLCGCDGVGCLVLKSVSLNFLWHCHVT